MDSLPKRIGIVVLFAFIIVCYLAFFYRLGDYGLWDPDEGRSGVIAKEMLASGNWITLTLNGEPYYDKPALYFWLVALGLKLLGLNEFAVRLPSALAASLTVGLVYLWGCAFGDWKRGLWGAAVLATSFEFVALGRYGKMDMLFTFFYTAALLSFLWWKRQGDSRGWLWSFYLFLALASVTKGPVGILLPLLIVGIAMGLTYKWTFFREMRLFQGMVIVVLVAGPWYLLAAFLDPEYIWAFLWDHNIVRFFTVESGVQHPEPIYFLFLVLMAGFLPWSIFLPPVLSYIWKHRRERSEGDTFFLFVWVITVLIFFSLARNKLGTYVLPAFPPLSLLTGDVLRQFMDGEESRPWRRRWIIYGSFVWLFLLLAVPPLSEMLFSERYPQYFSLNIPLFTATLFFLLAALGWVLRRERWIPWIVPFSSLWFVLWFYGVKAQEISELKSTRSLAQIIKGNAAKEYRVVAIRAESLSFYLSHPVRVVPHPAMIESLLEESTPTIALVKEKHLKEMPRISPSRLFVWKTIPSANALIANFPRPPAQNLGSTPKH